MTDQPMRSKSNLLPHLSLGIAVLALGFSALFVRWAAAPGPVMGLYRMGLSTLILAPIYQRRNQKRTALTKDLLIFPALGGVFLALDLALWNTSVLYTKAANATLMGNTAPLWVALVAWLFLRERLKFHFWIGLALTLTGAAIVLGSDFILHPTFGWGDVMALIAGLFYAGYYLVTQQGRKRLDTLSYIWWMCLSSSISLFIISLIFGMPIFGYSQQTYLAFLGSAIVTQVGGYLATTYALGHIPASVVSPTMIGQPVMTALLAIPFLGEILPANQWLGGLGVIMGIFLVHRSRERE
jgi:drug/metabolite transporter (DMT)-like permease